MSIFSVLDRLRNTPRSPAQFNALAQQIVRSTHTSSLASAAHRIAAYVDGRMQLQGLNLYLALESCTPLIALHAVFREGERNRYRNGLQQSYGDHNRLLLLGLDMLDNRQPEWYGNRLAADLHPVERPELVSCFSEYESLKITRQHKVILWLGAAFHDFGKLYRPGAGGLDAEDAPELCRPIASVLFQALPPGSDQLFEFVLRNHDIIEGVTNGTTPANFIRLQVLAIPNTLRQMALPFLGLVQLAGAASLGEGRITQRKIQIYLSCMRGTILDRGEPMRRFDQLVRAGSESGKTERIVNSKSFSVGFVNNLEAGRKTALQTFFDQVVLHNWEQISGEAWLVSTSAGRELLSQFLVELAFLWREKFSDHQHVLITAPTVKMIASTREATSTPGVSELPSLQTKKLGSIRLLNGAKTLLV